MEYKWKEAKLLVSLLRAGLGGEAPVLPDDVDWENLAALATLQKVEALVSVGLSKAAGVPQEVLQKFQTVYKKEIVAYQIRQTEGLKILNAFEVNGIDCVPLKGWIIKDMYPNPALRYMCDMDILFKPEQSAQVQKILESLGYTAEELGGNPEVYYKKPIMNIEMHKRIIRDKTDHFDTSWERVKLKKNCDHTFYMTDEDYYLFMIAHLHKHFVGGGTGVRSVCDVEVFLREKENTLDFGYIEEKLRASELDAFDQKVRALSKAWFHDAPADAELTAFSQKLLFCGVFGTQERSAENLTRSILETMPGKSSKTKKLFYYLTLLFPALSVMQDLFPVLHKAPFLLPLFWIVRLVRNAVTGRENAKKILKNTEAVSEEDLHRNF